MERRKQYRVEIGQGIDLEVTVRASGGSSVGGQLFDVSVEGMGVSFVSVRFSMPVGLALQVGGDVELVFTSSLLKNPVVISARVVNRADREGSCRYGFQFTDRQQLEKQLSPVLFKLFNRRASYRVAPAHDSPVTVTVEGGPRGMRAQTRVVDISTTGVGVCAPLEVESALADTDRVTVFMSLPNYEHPLVFAGIIRNRRLTAAEILYGIEFDLERSENPRRQQDAVIEYVMKRQRECLRQGKAA